MNESQVWERVHLYFPIKMSFFTGCHSYARILKISLELHLIQWYRGIQSTNLTKYTQYTHIFISAAICYKQSLRAFARLAYVVYRLKPKRKNERKKKERKQKYDEKCNDKCVSPCRCPRFLGLGIRILYIVQFRLLRYTHTHTHANLSSTGFILKMRKEHRKTYANTIHWQSMDFLIYHSDHLS